MTRDPIQQLWEKAKSIDRPPAIGQLDTLFRPAAFGQLRLLKLNVWSYLPIIAATVVLDVINLAGYWSNTGVLAVQVGLTVAAVGFFTFGAHLLKEIAKMERADEPLAVFIDRCLQFYRSKFEIWHVMVAGLVLLLSFAVNSLTDNMGGEYRINNPSLFVKIALGIFAFMYIMIKGSLWPFTRTMKTLLADLQSQTIDGTGRVARLRSLWQWYGLALVVLFVALVIWSVVMSLRQLP